MKLSRTKDGRFKKGNHYSKKTEFKKGEHWRSKKDYWDYDWLYNEYITKKKTLKEISESQNCGLKNIWYFLKKYKIPRRDTTETRKTKHWGLSGPLNGMYGKNGKLNPNWKGGMATERQIFNGGSKWKKTQKFIFKRDNYLCQRCNSTHTMEVMLHVHHIKSFADYPKFRLTKSNLITLCKNCHAFVHSKLNINNEFRYCVKLIRRKE